MTTPERLRRRQIRNDWFIAGLAIALAVVFVYFQGQAEAQRQCLTNYISNNSQTSAMRAKIQQDDSRTTHAFLLDATDPKKVQTKEQFEHVRAIFVKRIGAIDAARAAHPVQPLPKGVCD